MKFLQICPAGLAILALLGAAGCREQPAPEPQLNAARVPGLMAQAPRTQQPAQEPRQQAESSERRVAAAQDAVTSYARAELMPVGDSETTGIVSFMEGVPASNGIRVIAEFINIPAGTHGIHIHENGDCSASDASSAGGHFDPLGQPHADRTAPRRHTGDLGNIVADEDNLASLDFHDTKLSFDGATSIIGKAVIVHSDADDLQTQPDGNAGQRIACGVIEARDARDLFPAEE